MSLKLSFKPLTTDQWEDFVTLFGERGACGGCWCMLWRLARKAFEAQKGESNKLAMMTIVESGEVPGILSFITVRLSVGAPLPPEAAIRPWHGPAY